MVPVERRQFWFDFVSYSHSITIMVSVWSVFLHRIDRVRDTGITTINVPIPAMLCRLMFGIKWCDDLKMMRKLQYFCHYGLTRPIDKTRDTELNPKVIYYNSKSLLTSPSEFRGNSVFKYRGPVLSRNGIILSCMFSWKLHLQQKSVSYKLQNFLNFLLTFIFINLNFTRS